MQRVRSQVWTLAEIDSILEALEMARPDYGEAYSVARRAMGIQQLPERAVRIEPPPRPVAHGRLLTDDRW